MDADGCVLLGGHLGNHVNLYLCIYNKGCHCVVFHNRSYLGVSFDDGGEQFFAFLVESENLFVHRVTHDKII